MGQRCAPAASDRLAPARCARPPAARQRRRPDAEIAYGGEVSLPVPPRHAIRLRAAMRISVLRRPKEREGATSLIGTETAPSSIDGRYRERSGPGADVALSAATDPGTDSRDVAQGGHVMQCGRLVKKSFLQFV